VITRDQIEASKRPQHCGRSDFDGRCSCSRQQRATQSADRPAWLGVSGDQNTLVLVNGQRISETNFSPRTSRRFRLLQLNASRYFEAERSAYGGGATAERSTSSLAARTLEAIPDACFSARAATIPMPWRRHWELPAKHWDSTSARAATTPRITGTTNALRPGHRGRQRPICGGARSDHAGFRHRITGRPASRALSAAQIGANRADVFPNTMALP